MKLPLAAVALALLASACGPRVVWYGKSEGRAHQAIVLEDAGGQRVRLDGKDGRSYLGIGVDALSFSPDGRRFAYAARRAAGWVVVVDGVEGPAFEGVSSLTWSRRGGHVAYAGARHGRWAVVRDGSVGAPCDGVRARSLRFSEDGEHLAFAADQGRRVIVDVDGRRSAPFDAVGKLELAGDLVAFVGRRGEASFVVVNGQESEPLDEVADLAIARDGRDVAFTARRDGAWSVNHRAAWSRPFDRVGKLAFSDAGLLAYAWAVDGHEGVAFGDGAAGPFDAVAKDPLVFDRSGRRVAFAARTGRVFRVIESDAMSEGFDEVSRPAFVGASPALAFVARHGRASFVVVDGHASPPHAALTELTLSPDGRRYAVVADDTGRPQRVVHGLIVGTCGDRACRPEERGAFAAGVVLEGSLTFTPDGAHVGWIAGDEATRRLSLMLDGRPEKPFDTGELVASAVGDSSFASSLADGSRISSWVRAEADRAARHHAEASR